MDGREQQYSQIKRRIGLFTATAIVVANMIGTGIFTTSGIMAGNLPGPGWVLFCWLFGGLIALAGALCYAELATRMPHEGGEYLYLRELYHPAVGFLTGWTSFFVGFSAPIAGSALAFVAYFSAGFSRFLPDLDPSHAVMAGKGIAVSIIVVFTCLHYLGVRAGARVQNVLTVIKVIILVGLTSAGMILGAGSWGHLTGRVAAPSGGLAFGTAMMLVMFAYSGWNASAYIAGEVKDPRRTLPRSLVTGTVIVIVLYLAVNLFIIRSVPFEGLRGTIPVVETAAVGAFGEWMGAALSVMIGIALLSSLSAFLMIGPRVYFAMARDRLFFPFAAQVHPRSGVPGRSILMQGGLAAIITVAAGVPCYYLWIRGIGPARRITAIILLCAAVLPLAPCANAAAPAGPTDGEEWEVLSPDRRLAAAISVNDGIPRYRMSYDGKVILLPSRLGFTFANAGPMMGGFTIAGRERRSFEEVWEPVWGETARVENRYNELTVALEESRKPRRRMIVILRAFDDGLGLRYVLPEQGALREIEIASEETRFRFADDHTVWWIPADYDSYEHLYTRSPLSGVASANTPVTIETTDGLFVSIHEADLTDYAGMTLVAAPGEELTLACDLVPWPDGVKVRGSVPMRTPWRTVQVATRPGGLIESHLIVNLNEPCAIDDTSWIRPMKYIGIWWEMHIKKSTWHTGDRHGATTENAKRYIDFAARHAIPAVLIEGWNTGWDRWGRKDAYDFVTPYPDFDIGAIVHYGRERGVAIIGHHETGGDVPAYETNIDSAFALYRRLGIPAVKTGYAGGIFPRGQHHHGQWMVNHYRRVVEKAARYRLMLDVHEPVKPTGIRRTYPNMMTCEGVRGMEYNAWSEGNPPEHTTILPFTRMLAGPLDYTPGIFDITFEQYQEVYRVHTTLAKQLALYVVLYSPLQMAADLPENYEGHPAFAFIEEVPVDWDETRVLHGKIGDYVTIARRSGERWYIGSVTDEEARVLRASLDFLSPGVRYRARIYADTPYTDWERTPTLYEISDIEVGRETVLDLKLAPGGGQAISIAPLAAE